MDAFETLFLAGSLPLLLIFQQASYTSGHCVRKLQLAADKPRRKAILALGVTIAFPPCKLFTSQFCILNFPAKKPVTLNTHGRLS
jgi:hypothetical protein